MGSEPAGSDPGDHGGIVKKLLLIIVLPLLQCACAAPGGKPGQPASLLSFETIGREIAVRHEPAADADELSRAVALNP